MEHDDYLYSICLFLTITDVLNSFVPLSLYYYNFLNDIRSKKLIETLINYKFGNNYLKLLNVHLKYNETNSIFKQIYLLFNDWDYIVKCAMKSQNITVKQFNIKPNNERKLINVSFLHYFNHYTTYTYWFTKVMYILFFVLTCDYFVVVFYV